MNIYRNCLLVLTLCASTGLSPKVFSASFSPDAQGSKLKALASGRWVPSEKFVEKDTYCYREYTCISNRADRFGRNVRIKGKRLQRGKVVCSGPSNTCQCKTVLPTPRCDVKFLKRR